MIEHSGGNRGFFDSLFRPKRRRSQKSAVVALAVASASLLLAACGSSSTASSTSSSSASGAGTTAQSAAAKGPIKIGMITSLTGPYTPLGTNDKLGAEQEVNAINSAGGIGGRKIDLIVEDDATNPTQAVVDFKTLQSDGVVAMVGPVFSSACMAIISDVEAAKIPAIDTCADDSQVTPVRQYVFMTPPTTSIVGQQLLAYMKYKGLTKMAVAYDTTAFGEAGWNEMKLLASDYASVSSTVARFRLPPLRLPLFSRA